MSMFCNQRSKLLTKFVFTCPPSGRYNFRNGTERRNGTTAFRSGFYKNMIIYGTERVAFRLIQESYNFRNGTERLRSGFYKNMIIYGTERSVAWIIISVTAERNDCVSFRILQEYDIIRNGTGSVPAFTGIV